MFDYRAGYTIFIVAWLLICLLALAVPIVIGVFVFRDARRLGMSNPVAWALLAALVPSFVGLVIYLLMRHNGGEQEDQKGA